jgi:acyl-coenzyme A thioesterase PaaI-like protein
MSPNKLNRMIAALYRLPAPARRHAMSLLLGRIVPFVGTASMTVEQMTDSKVSVRIPNRRKNRNHIGQVHAAAMALAAETATGFVVGMNVPDSRLLLIKSLKVDFKKRSRGDMLAVATLTEAQQEEIRTKEKGDVLVEVHVTDQSGEEPIRCEMVWAWIPKKR